MYSSRNSVILLLTTTILYPLCVQKDLSALKSVSAFGILGHLSAMGALGVRLWDKSYRVGGTFYKGSPLEKAATMLAPAVPAADWSKVFVLASLLSYCFVCHYNAPRYYSELEGKEADEHKFLKMTALSYGSGALIYMGTMILGLHLFGPLSASFALNSFSINDPLGMVARVAFGSSVLASFPLIFLNMRNYFAASIFPSLKSDQITALLLGLIALLTSVVTDIGVVGSIAGALFGSSMMFIFPPLMYMGALRKSDKTKPMPRLRTKLAINTVLLICGTALGGFGTFNSVKAAFKR